MRLLPPPSSHRAGRRRLLAGLPLLAAGLLPKQAQADPAVRRASQPLMGTQVDITVQAHAATDAAAASVAINAAFAEMSRLNDMMSRYRGDSMVNALHLAAGLQALPVAPEMLRVLQMARQMSERSAGAFDITVGVFSGWGFDPDQTRVPDRSEINRELPLVNYRHLLIDAESSQAYLRRRGMKIDLGGIAKLPILQAGMHILQSHGLAGALINGGGDVLVSGHLQGRPWRIGLRDPRAPQKLLGTVALTEGCVAASGDYERCFARAGRRYHHILDPKTGMPSSGPHGVALIARRIEDINGLGAAIMVGGGEAGRRWLASLPGVDALIVEADQRLWLSPGMAARLRA